MSPNTTINIQIQMKNKKNQSIDQNTWPVPNSARIMGYFSNLMRVNYPSGLLGLGFQHGAGRHVGGTVSLRNRRP